MCHSLKKGWLNVSAKCFGPGQAAQSEQADLDRNILLLVSFMKIIEEPYYQTIHFGYQSDPSIINHGHKTFRRSLKAHSKCKRLMIWSIHPGH